MSYKDYEAGERWPAHPDDDDNGDVPALVDSLEELSELSASASDPAPIQLNAADLKLQR